MTNFHKYYIRENVKYYIVTELKWIALEEPLLHLNDLSSQVLNLNRLLEMQEVVFKLLEILMLLMYRSMMTKTSNLTGPLVIAGFIMFLCLKMKKLNYRFSVQ